MQLLNSYLAIYILMLFLAPVLRSVLVLKVTRREQCHPALYKGVVTDFWLGLNFIYNIFFKKSDKNYLEATHHAFEKLGSTYSVKRWMWETTFTRDSKNIKHVLAEDFKSFQLPGIRVSAMKPLLGSGIFSLNGNSWSYARGILKPCFVTKDKEALLDMLEGHFQAFLKRVPRCDEVDLQPLFFCLAMDFATDFLAGKSTNLLDAATTRSEAQQFVDDYMVCSEEVVAKMSLGPLQHFRISPSSWFAKRRIFKFVDKFIQGATADTEIKGDSTCYFLRELSAVTTDQKVLRDQMLHILVASRDTIASLLSNLFFVLAKRPDVYGKLREEVLVHVGDEAPSSQDLKQMEYLKWCIQESLRLHPVIPTNAREASRDTALPRGGGIDGNSPLLIKKGTVVMYNVYSMHRDEDVFGAQPEEFHPERWSGLRPGWGYLPFNGGPRICLGQQLALLEVQYIVVRILQEFSALTSCDNREWTELFALATTCKHGAKVKMQ